MDARCFGAENRIPSQAAGIRGVAGASPPRGGTLKARLRFTSPMGEDTGVRTQLRFGVFEVDLRAGELRKRGLRVRLQQQPFQVLSTLIEHAGEVVTREELQKKLWPADTFVDFD